MIGPSILLLFNLGTPEILFIILVALLLFGAQKIPELARSLGRAQREFTKARQQLEEEEKPKTEADTSPTPPATEEERVRKAAQDLGIPVNGKETEELRRAIAEKMQAPSPP